MLNPEWFSPEVLVAGITAGGFLAFTTKQRLAIREQRDGGKCQFPEHMNGHAHECGGKGLQVHHILPQRYCERIGINPDFPENAITLCENAHKLIHPDMELARKMYGIGKQAYYKMFQVREELLDKRQVYWNTLYDREMNAQAIRNTQKAKLNGWEFPEGKRK